MTASTAVRRAPRTGPRVAVRDALTIACRDITVLRRLPRLLVFATVQPVLFVLMFRYVFGGAIVVPGVSYVNYLMPGIVAQTVAFGAITTRWGCRRTPARVWSTGSAPCRWRAQLCWPAGPSPTSSATSASSCSLPSSGSKQRRFGRERGSDTWTKERLTVG